MGIQHVLAAVVIGGALVACNPVGDPNTVEQAEGDLYSRVQTALTEDAATAGLAIELDVEDQTVQLNGFVDDAEQKQAAARVAREVEGVVNVQNNLVIGDADQPLRQDIEDVALRLKVEAALVADDDADAMQINAEVLDGVVQLSGFVETQAEKKKAGRIVREIEGVTEVRNDVAVRSEIDDDDHPTKVTPKDRDGDGVRNKRDFHDGVGDEKRKK